MLFYLNIICGCEKLCKVSICFCVDVKFRRFRSGNKHKINTDSNVLLYLQKT